MYMITEDVVIIIIKTILTMKLPTKARNIFALFSSTLTVSPAILLNSNSLKPPRLFTKSTTSSDPSFLNGKKDLSGSDVDMINSRSGSMSLLSGGIGESRVCPGSL